MTRIEILDHCLEKPGAWRDEPWDGTLVAKVDARIFCFVGGGVAGVKCGDRVGADEWMLRHPKDVKPMPSIGRSGWNTLSTGRSIPDRGILDATDDCYLMVWPDCQGGGRRNGATDRLTKAVREVSRFSATSAASWALLRR